ncbi:hypothetical protein C8F01DRAFT_1262383 [Mycena amicta]|nr:hypothetical protein C8F01DRAFT_1262383 [Mycena amicta]
MCELTLPRSGSEDGELNRARIFPSRRLQEVAALSDKLLASVWDVTLVADEAAKGYDSESRPTFGRILPTPCISRYKYQIRSKIDSYLDLPLPGLPLLHALVLIDPWGCGCYVAQSLRLGAMQPSFDSGSSRPVLSAGAEKASRRRRVLQRLVSACVARAEDVDTVHYMGIVVFPSSALIPDGRIITLRRLGRPYPNVSKRTGNSTSPPLRRNATAARCVLRATSTILP